MTSDNSHVQPVVPDSVLNNAQSSEAIVAIHRQGTDLSTSSTLTASSSSPIFSTPSINAINSPREAGYAPLRSTTSLDVFAGSTQSLSVFAGSTPSLVSTTAIENAPLSPTIPAAPHPTPILASTTPRSLYEKNGNGTGQI
jgi:hypothetical protein